MKRTYSCPICADKGTIGLWWKSPCPKCGGKPKLMAELREFGNLVVESVGTEDAQNCASSKRCSPCSCKENNTT